MRRYALSLALLALLPPMTSPASTAAAQQPQGLTTLSALRDQARPLLIFAPGPNDSQLEIQLRILQEHAPAVSDRQIVPIALPFNSPSSTTVRLSDADAQAARRRFHVAPSDFTVLLLGKDGGPKLRSGKPLSMNTLNGTIDAMPMRQDEMRAEHH